MSDQAKDITASLLGCSALCFGFLLGMIAVIVYQAW